VATADFNHDHRLDLVVAVRVQIHYGQGNGKFVKKTVFDPGDTPTSVKVWDFNQDGELDLAVANNGAIGTISPSSSGKGTGHLSSPNIRNEAPPALADVGGL
jgi:hypothetical protein